MSAIGNLKESGRMNYAGLQHLYGVTSMHKILEALGEGGKSILTGFVKPKISLVGQSDRLMVLTVDGDPNNIIHSNVAIVDESIVKTWKCVVSYKISCEFGLVRFRTPLDFRAANQEFLSKASYADFCLLTGGFPLSQESLIRAWEYLAQHHVKGIEQIDFDKHDVSIDLISMQMWQQVSALQLSEKT